ncbi:MAG TPA: NADPH-dependent FMN reductase, partial [Pseudomonadales bacterium]|nr:NADPH-dependent FMN reductase [Pseudomonadales bacterium]
AAVRRLQQGVAEAHAVLIASPEYAHGISGVMKNALDWLVSFEPFCGKAVAIFNASPRAHHALDALREVLNTMSARIIEPACITLPLLGSGISMQSLAENQAIANTIQDALTALLQAVRDTTPA